MEILIKETGDIKQLTIVFPATGIEWTRDLMGDALTWNDACEMYTCTTAEYEWWSRYISEKQALEDRIHELGECHGLDAVLRIVEAVGPVDIEDEIAEIHAALDRAFCVEMGEA